ncbi:hypoxanthine phosphoribosyltransferase [Prosthecochloris sp. GSB1]|uniref:hypoxanthine phosphoribosyltransferase n=1 Tax=Prosthecochloris sp. GSB1 TaxID=281093 RepID=UPI000B8D03A0|nr:hypoxanthine phosphoribosyltransferase [Prosthecochloris sp. GSB1]ASQ90849.1 hypoxanthine phosphoribosyltransferase [Prosthecochloris sp. GSB1]
MNAATVTRLISEETISRRVKELGERITADYRGTDNLLFITVLKGAFMFAADLLREVDVPCGIEFIRASSYDRSTRSSGRVELACDLDIGGHDVLLVEDIVDTGLTISRIEEEFRKQRPSSLRLCTLLDKPSARKFPVRIDYSGFQVPDRFVVGYGIDYAEKHRELPFIGTIDENP